MARIDWVEHRLLNWARWRLSRGGGVLGYAAVDLADASTGRDGYRETVVPVSDVEATQTDSAVARLADDLARAVRAWYLRREGKEQAAMQARCAVSTMFARVDLAHVRLAQDLNEQDQRARDERARVEALQRTTGGAGGFTT